MSANVGWQQAHFWTVAQACIIGATVRVMKALHDGQTDRQGRAYWTHPYRVMLRCQGYANLDIAQTALLHDVLEDCSINSKYLCDLGFSVRVVDSVRVLTRTKPPHYRELSEREQLRCYNEYIDSIVRSGNRVAATVKLADLADNSASWRMEAVSRRHRRRYARAFPRLASVVDGSLIRQGDVHF